MQAVESSRPMAKPRAGRTGILFQFNAKEKPSVFCAQRAFCIYDFVVSGLTNPRPAAIGLADSASGIHQPGYEIAASSLGFCEAKLRSFPPTAKSGLGQVAKGVPVGHGPL